MTKSNRIPNDSFAIISQFEAGNKWTGVSVDGATHKAVRGGQPSYPFEKLNLSSGEEVRLFRFTVRGQEVDLMTRYAKLTEEDASPKTLCYVRNEDAPLFPKEDAVIASANDLDEVDA